MSTVLVKQATHDNLQGNANIQVGDADVANGNPVPVHSFGGPYEVTLTLDVNIYASGDLLADTQVITNICANNGSVIPVNIRATDLDDQGCAMDLKILRSNTTLGTENAAFAPTDTMGLEILWNISILASDWIDEGLYRWAQKSIPDGIAAVLAPAVAGPNLWIAAVCKSGTPTYTVNGIHVTIGVLQNG